MIRPGSIVVSVVAVIFLVVFSRGCRTVSKGTVGVQSTFGKIHPEPLEPGLHWVKPFIDSIEHIDTKLQSYEVEAKAASKDLQKVMTLISVQHALKGPMAPETVQAIGNLTMLDEKVISPAVQESLKAVTAKYTAEELITMREQVKNETSSAIESFITHTLKESGVEGAIHISNVAIKDFDFSDSFNQSIEDKVRAQQDALQAENRKKQKVTEAEAAMEASKRATDAEAYQITQNSIARAESIKREALALSENPLLLQLRATEAWDGKLPYYMGGEQPIPFLQVQVPSQNEVQVSLPLEKP